MNLNVKKHVSVGINLYLSESFGHNLFFSMETLGLILMKVFFLTKLWLTFEQLLTTACFALHRLACDTS